MLSYEPLEIVSFVLYTLQEISETYLVILGKSITSQNLMVSFFLKKILFWSCMIQKLLHLFQYCNHKWRNVIICSVCGRLPDHHLQTDSRNVYIYTIPWLCYNHCQQNEFVRLLFYVLVKISVAKTGPKTFNALCAR